MEERDVRSVDDALVYLDTVTWAERFCLLRLVLHITERGAVILGYSFDWGECSFPVRDPLLGADEHWENPYEDYLARVPHGIWTARVFYLPTEDSGLKPTWQTAIGSAIPLAGCADVRPPNDKEWEHVRKLGRVDDETGQVVLMHDLPWGSK